MLLKWPAAGRSGSLAGAPPGPADGAPASSAARSDPRGAACPDAGAAELGAARAALAPLLNELADLLGVGDTAAIALYTQHAAELRAALGPAGATLERQIGQFAFDSAERTLRELG